MANNSGNQQEHQEHQEDWRPSDRNREEENKKNRPPNPRGTIKEQMFQALNDPTLSPNAKVQALASINNTLTIKYLVERQNQLYENIERQLNRMNGLFDGIVKRMDA